MQPDCSLKAEEELTGRGDCFKPYKDFLTSSQRGSLLCCIFYNSGTSRTKRGKTVRLITNK